MKLKWCFILSSLLILSACSSSGGSTSSGGGSSADTTSVTSAHVKALSKIKNVQTKNTSKNGSSSFGLFSTTNLPSEIAPLVHGNQCFKFNFDFDFTNASESSQQIPNCTSTDVDFTHFNNSDMTKFTPSEIMISERTMDDGSKKRMAFYQDQGSHAANCHTLTGENYCFSAFFTDPEFYKDEFYGIFSNGGTFMFDAYNKNKVYNVLYFWDDTSLSVDVTNPHQPKVPTQAIYITMGTKSTPCKFFGPTEDHSSDPCIFFIGIYNDETNKHERYIGEYRISDSYKKNDHPHHQSYNSSGGEEGATGGGGEGATGGGGEGGTVPSDNFEAVFDLFYVNNAEWDAQTNQIDYFKNTVKALCEGSPTANYQEKYFKNKVGYMVHKFSTGGFNVTTLASDYSKDGSGGVNFKEDDKVAIGEAGSDCARIKK